MDSDALEGAIAIIGMAGRFPGARDVGELWRNLRDGVESVTFFSEEELLASGVDPALLATPGYVRAGAVLKGVDEFDASFFGISRREAELTDPQHRIFLENAWEAIESAGYDPHAYEGSIGVFAGASVSTYLLRELLSGRAITTKGAAGFLTLVGNDKDYLATRVAHKLDLRGPSVSIQTACSTSLVAVHMACASLLARECDMALAGGVTVRIPHRVGYLYEEGFIFTPDGHCRAFDAGAQGTHPGSGSGVVLLKRLADAIEDGDFIHAIVRGSAVNNDGAAKVGFTAPSEIGQAHVITEALAVAGVEARSIGYVEAHGTGTAIGDPIEISALTRAFRADTEERQFCAVGSIKSNMGHLESAAGIASLIKAVLALRHRKLPPSLHVASPNPLIDFERSPFYVNTALKDWDAGEMPRRAGVSSFGIGGTNAHVVLEEAPPVAAPAPSAEAKLLLLPLSAKSPESLSALAGAYVPFLSDSDAGSLEDIVFTASLRRRHHEHRLAVVGASREEMAAALEAFARGEDTAGVAVGKAPQAPPKVVFVFPGQGSQWAGMGRQLFAEEPAFRRALEACDQAIRREAGFSVIEALHAEDSAARLGAIDVVQPALFAIEVALAALWRAWGVEPDAVVGHSMGEVAAAHVAGALSLRDAAAIICRRSRLLRRVSGRGVMALCELPVPEAEAELRGYEDRLSIAVSNGPRSTVIAGEPAAMDELLARLERKKVFCRRVKVDVASHSPQMDPLREELVAALRDVAPAPVGTPMRSTVTGEWLRGGELTAAYWADNLRKPVLFGRAIGDLLEGGHQIFLEMSPHPLLVPSVEEILLHGNRDGAAIASLQRDSDERRCLLRAAGALYARGYAMAWKKLRPEGGRVVLLPSYAWQRTRYWVDAGSGADEEQSSAAVPASAAAPAPSGRLYEIVWQEEPCPVEPAPVAGSWLVLHRGTALARALLSRSAPAGARCIPGALDAPAAAYRAALEAAGPGGLQGVVCVWGGDDGTSGAERAEAASVAALQFVHEIFRREDAAPPRLLWVTEGAQAVRAGEPVAVAEASLWGLGRAVIAERPELGCTLVDLEPSASDAVDALLRELGRPDDEDQIAWRGGKRYAARLVEARPRLELAGGPRIAAQSTVLITGGLGALGLRVARWLREEHGVQHLLLAGRRAPAGDQLAAIEALRAAGARVTLAQVDVADASQVEAALQLVPADLPLSGVIHAAAVLDDGVLSRQTAERYAQVLAPKARGAWNLHQATRDVPLDFFVLFSSGASVLGAAGQSSYAAGNAFLDGLAHARRAEGLPAHSLSWGPWGEVGLAMGLDDLQRARVARQGLGMLPPAQAIALLGRALARPEAHLCPLSLDVEAARRASPAGAPAPLWRALVAPRPALGGALRLAELSPSARRRELEAAVRGDVAKVLSLGSASDTPVDRPLRELGLDSLMALELRNRLSARIGRPLSATVVFDHPTVAALSRFLCDQVAGIHGERPAIEPAPRPRDEPIAVVAIGCRFPGGVRDPESFWRLLERGEDAVGEVPRERWDIDAYYDPDPDAPGKMMSRWGGFLEGVDLFDPSFFEISPREAAGLDPQQRLFLEVSWEAIERAGLPPEALMGSDTGVFLGICTHDYQTLARGGREGLDPFTMLGTAHSMSVGRLSYWLGLRGPNMPVDTACSSSLVAIHLACQALRNGECSLALAGGVNLILSPEHTVGLTKTRALSPTGRCRAFSADADGFVRSEGCGVLVLERLSDAVRRGDPILAVVRGSAINQDGRSNGPTAPSGPAQEVVIRRALAQAGVPPSGVGYVEAHGTGTQLGDPIEVQALGAVLGEGRAPERPVIVGSVKTNIGHTEAAAGVAGVIKAVLALQRARIPRSLHFTASNPHIPWAELPVKVASEETPWPDSPRIAAVSSFGLSGTNANVVLEEAPPPAARSVPRADDAPVLFPVSAHGPEALVAAAAAYGRFLSAEGGGDASPLRDIAYTASVRRGHREHRLAVVGSSRAEIGAALEAFGRGEAPAGVVRGRASRGAPPRVVFVLSGQGSQWAGMGRALLAEEPAFRAAVEGCEPLVQRYAGFSLLAELTAEEEASRLGETEVAQPAIFAMQVALSALWASWGVVPDAVIGHSVGEVAAAHISGALELEEAVRLVCTRGRVMQRATGLGKMASVALREEEAARALRGYEDRLAIGAVNDPGSVVLSGEAAALAEVLERLERQGVEGRMLRVDYAFHSPQMEPLAGELARELGGLAARPGALAMYSTVEGGLIEGGALDTTYWPRNVREPARFARAVEAALGDGYQTFVEVGPHPVLSLSVERCLSARGAEGRAVPTLRRDQGGRGNMLSALAKLYAHGHAVDFGRLYPEGGRVVALPAYPWQRERYWIETARSPAAGSGGVATRHPLLGARIAVAGAKAVFEATLGMEAVPYLGEHRVFGQAVIPGTGLLELARAAGEALGLGTSSRVEGLVVGAPLSLPEQGWVRVQVVVSEATDAGHAVAVYSQPLSSRPEGGWTEHAVGRLRVGSGEAPVAAADLGAARARCGTGVDVAELYGSFEGMGLSYGPTFRGLEALWRGHGEVVARVALPAQTGEGAGPYGAHPALLDAALQALGAAFGAKLGSETYLPWEIGGFVVRQPGVTSAWVHARATGAAEGPAEVLSGDVLVLDEGGAAVAELSGVRFKRADAAALRRAMTAAPLEDLYAITWQERRPAGDETGPSGAWVLLRGPEEDVALARALEARLRSAGAHCTTAEVAREAGAIAAMLDGAGPERLQGVVCLWGGGAGASTAERAEAASLEALAVVQALSRREDKAPPRLFWVTEAAQAVRPGEPVAAAAASLWGLGRSVMLERPELGCTLVDLEPGAGDAAEALWHELGKSDDEREIAWRTGQRHVARLCRVAARSGLSVPDAPSYRLEIAQKGLLDQLRLLPAERRAPGPGEIEIEVKASGLNFRDVIRALGMDPSEGTEMGGECAGVVTALGEGVQHLAVGDAVMAIAPGAFRRFVTVDARLASPQPVGLSAAEAAALPIVFLTAWYALHELAGLKRGERLLLHAAAGGVGMAAVQVAQWLGAEVLATASPSKWGVVRAMGVERVESSRTLAFADAYRTAGVDVVLNALAGEFVDASLSLLSAGGRFLEMGKTDIRSAEAVGAAHPGVMYRAFDLLEVEPDRIQQMFRRVSEGFAAGWLRPLPVRAFAVTEAEAALRFMAQARHTGKIVLLPAPKAALIAAQSTVLITGGLGALGLHVARWLWQEHGVQHLVLAGRRAPEGAQRAAVEALREAGARVTVVQADVADAAAVQALVSSVPAELPLRGVIHAAGVLEDGVLSEQTEAQYTKVFAPKARGAWNLHEATRTVPLELFVLFSSSASLLGAAGQANYAAANAYLDGLAQRRRAEGLPAHSVSWGPWADGGMVETLSDVQRARFARMGVGALAPAQGLSLLGRALSRPEAHLGALELDLRALGRALGADVPPVWRTLVQPRSTQAAVRASAPTQETWRSRLAALSPEARAAEVDAMVRGEAARVLSLSSSSDLEADRPLQELGLDSLMALELRNALSARVGKALPATLLFDRPTVAALRRYLLDEALLPGEQKAPLAAVQPRVAPREEPIAIVGIGCRFPGGVHDLESFWRLLEGEVDAVREVPRERWDIDAYYDPDPEVAGKMVTRWGGFLEDVDRFDPAFFGISPREAASIDPQQRLLLETTWEALERAGLPAEALAGTRTGVYVGICGNEYQAMMLARGAERFDPYSLLGSAHSATVGRLSYWLGLQGPNMAVDTACSSSLVAVHLACQALRSGECTTALAGGVNLVLTPEPTVYFSRMRAMSPSGGCRAFSADADGYVRGEGCGVLVLKRLSDAERDGDPILAVIRGSAVNQDGRSQGLTAPNGPAQEAVIRQALAQAGVSPASVGYVETHGTGTPLGDPIEAQALGAVLGEGRPAGAPLWIGSVKTNIGHTEGAAGVAGLIKAVLALSHERIPRSLHFTAPNPHIAWSELPLQVASEPVPWPPNGKPRIAGVSSFGFSGTNAHVLLEEAPRRALVEAPAEAPANEATAYLLPLSAKSPEALSALAATYATFLPASDARLGDIAYTASARRSHHEHRLAVAGGSKDELAATLAAYARGDGPSGVVEGKASPVPPKVVFVFSGQGSQWAGMGTQLLEQEPVFRSALEACDEALRPHLGGSVIDAMREPEERSRLGETEVAQPALFAIEVALAALLRSWGLVPEAVIGHSVGEIAAAHVAGILDLDEAARLVALRARIMQRATGQGKMISVSLAEDEAKAAIAGLEPRVGVAAVNAPRQVVLSGDAAALDAVAQRLVAQGVACRELRVKYAFHSPQMDPLRSAFVDAIGELAPKRAAIPMLSTVTGAEISGQELDVSYWGQNLRGTVRFAQAVAASLAKGHCVFVEVGPHPVLSLDVEQCLAARGEAGRAVATLQRGKEERTRVLHALGALYAHGAHVSWERLYPEGGRVVALPAYPWQRRRYWIETSRSLAAGSGGAATGHPLLGALTPAAFAEAVFEVALSAATLPYLADHRVFGEVIVPGAALLEIVRAAAATRLGWERVRVTSLVIQAPLRLPDAGTRRVQVVLPARSPEGAEVIVYSRAGDANPDDPWTAHARGHVSPIEAAELPTALDIGAARERCRTSLDVDGIYERFSATGLAYGPAFRGMAELRRGDREAFARVALPESARDGAEAYGLHPALLDAALHALAAIVDMPAADTYLPFEFGEVLAGASGVTEAWVHARIEGAPAPGAETINATLTLVDDAGQLVARVSNLQLKRAGAAALRDAGADAADRAGLLALRWQDKPLAREEAPPSGRWILVSRGSPAAQELAAGLGAAGASCLTVALGEDAGRLEEALGALGAEPLQGVVCLWFEAALEPGADEGATPPAAHAERASIAGLRIVQTLARRASPLRLVWVTAGAQAAGAGERPALSQAPLWGVGRVIMQEHPELDAALVDLDPDAEDPVAAVWAELSRADGEAQVAWRRGRRYVPRLIEAPPGQGERDRTPVRPDGTALVTGGLGALGLEVARWLWEQHRVQHLLLVGRRAPSEDALATIERLRDEGARVTVAQADVADPSALRALLDVVPAEWPLRGVVHAAGVLDDGVLAEQTAARFERVMAPKIRGAWGLHEATRGAALDYFVLFSSATSLLGNAGQANYAAANAFLDALAHLRRAEGLPAHSLHWGPWKGDGMAAGLSPAARARLARMGVSLIEPLRGRSLLGHALLRPEAELLLMPIDLAAAQRSFGAELPPLWRELLAPKAGSLKAGATGLAARLLRLDAAARRAEVEGMVRAEIAKVLSLPSSDDVPEDRPLQELGLDSLMALELRGALSRQIGGALSATLAFDHPTVRALSRHLLEKVRVEEAPSDARAPAPRAAAATEPIAIVGFGCRYPGGVRDAESFWKLLADGVDAIREVPKQRWDIDALYDPDPDAPGKMITRHGGFLDDIDLFDPAFFGISPREARKMDPQQRLLLETSWEALESAGLVPEQLMDSDTGVFVGLMYHEYATLAAGAPEALDGYVGTGSSGSIASGRISYWLGLKGPSLTVDTACSSSLTTIHLACQSLRSGECTMALAGGVALMLTPAAHVEFSRLRGLARDGRCKSFDTSADGVAWSEGCGMVVLKRLSDAERDGDPILAVIRGSAVNQDGRSQGLTAPNGPSQEAVIRQALTQAGVSPASIQYVEAHGTGTPLGDPIEVQALGAALREGRKPEEPVRIGSVKSNFGHTQAAAGVAGVIKTVLAMQRGWIPRSLHFTEPSPHIPWSELPVQVVSEAVPWAANGRPRIAGVSSFGFSGTNAHVVLEEAPRRERTEAPATGPSSYLLPLSARSPEALVALASSWGALLSAPDARVRDLVFTAGARRSHHEHRLSVLGAGREELAAALDAFARGERPAGVLEGKALQAPPRVVFVFPGQGSQWAGMGRQLFAEEPAFRGALEACDAALRPHAGFSVIEAMAEPEERSRLGETEVAQPALFAIEVALAALLGSWGIAPEAVIGHSVGEIAAAHVAGILELDEAARLVALRARIMQRATGQGKMVSVALTEDEARAAIQGHEQRVGVAAVNAPRRVVLSGDAAALDQVVERLAAQGVACRELPVNYAFHSPQMDSLGDELVARIGPLAPRRARLPMISTVTGAPISGEELDAGYWGRNIVQTVRFAQAVGAAWTPAHPLFVEVGPHPVLSLDVEQCLEDHGGARRVVTTLRRRKEERRSALMAVGALYAHGYAVPWQKLHPEGGRVVPLPSYPWQRERYWIEAPARPPRQSAPARDGSSHPLLGTAMRLSALPGVHLWEQTLRSDTPAYLADHRVGGEVVLPAAGFVEIALAAGAELFTGAMLSIEGMTLESMLSLAADGERIIQTIVTDGGDSAATFQIASRAGGEAGWQRHAAGKVRAIQGDAQPRPVAERPAALRARLRATRSGAEHYERLQAFGLDYGPAFQGVVELAWGEGQALGRVRLPEPIEFGGHRLHPALLDACLQVSAGLSAAAGEGAAEAPYVPVAIAALHVHRWPGREVWVLAAISADQGTDERERAVDLRLMDEDGALLVELDGLRLRRIEGARRARDGLGEHLFEVVWKQADPSPEDDRAGLAREGVWLVLSDRGGVGESLRALLAARGQRCVQVVADTHYAQIAPDLYRIDLRSREDYGRLVRDALGERGPCLGAVHLFSLDAVPFEQATPEGVEEDLARGALSAAYLAQALLRQGWRDTPRLVLVTRGAQSTAGDDGPAVSQAPLWGLGRTIALEHPELRCTRIDLDPAAGAGDAELLLREFVARDREDQIALRGGDRLVARIARGHIAAGARGPYSLHAEGRYLITGGLGGLGLALGRWMVERGARHLVLVGRRGPDERAREAIGVMEAAGARVLVAQADVSRREDVERLIAQLRLEGPPLRGVVHAAGVLDDHTLLELSAESFRTVLGPKALGAFHLHRATRGEALTFFLVYSSAAALFGSPGQGNYTAANAFLDALARFRDRAGHPSMSIQWGPFAEVGMAAAADVRGQRLEARGGRSFTPAEGLEVLARLFEHPRPEIGVARFDARQWLEFYPRAAVLPFFAALREEAGAPRAARAEARRLLEATAPAARERILVRHLLEQVADVLRVDPSRLDPGAPLQDFGVDSLISLEVRNRLEDSLSLRLPAAMLFTYPTVASLARHLLAEIDAAEPGQQARPAAKPARENGARRAEEAIGDMTEHEAAVAVEAELAALEDYLT
ncbi:SDR family NAD(P)-dependent oxidoreductase [Sorangium sp. So ce302]|uniref:SDR family NAD(P)-dependent oxidoreductase n=1 Tax=Sorangium sp. So ce302 TaxID=3133297 RepID=UPI003F5FE750